MSDKLSRSLNLKYKNIVPVDNANLKEDNNTGVEQPLTIDVRLEPALKNLSTSTSTLLYLALEFCSYNINIKQERIHI